MPPKVTLKSATDKEIQRVMSMYDRIAISLKKLADKGDLNARCFHDCLVLVYESIQAGKILEARNALIKFYQEEVEPVKNSPEKVTPVSLN
jgi:hypothetical protein